MVKKILLILVLLTLIACNATKPVIVTKKPPLKLKSEAVHTIKKPALSGSSKEIVTVVKPVKKEATTRETEVIVSTSKTVVTNDVIVSYISKFKEIAMANKKTYEFNKNLKDLTVVDLKAKIQEDQLRLKKLEFAHAISPLENPMNIRGLRRDIARLKTELTKKEMGV